MTEIMTPRLVLRTPVDADADALFAVFGDPEAMRYIPVAPARDRSEMLPRIARRRELEVRHGYTIWTAALRATGTVIGDCGLAPVEGTGPEVEVAYHLAKPHWGKGYATEAAAAAIRYGLDVLGLDRIVGMTYPENVPSQRVLEKAGLRETAPRTYYGVAMKVYEVTR